MLALTDRNAGPYREKPSDFLTGQATRQPWAWDGLCFAVPFHDPTYAGARDVVAGVRPTYIDGSGGALTHIRDPRGNPVYQGNPPGRVSYLQYADNPRHDRPTTALTVYCRFRRLSDYLAYAGLVCNRYASTDPWVTWGIYGDAAATGKLGGGLAISGVAAELLPTGVIPTTQYVSGFMRWRSGEAPRLDILGERGDMITSAVHSSTLTGTLSYNAGEGIRINSTQDDLAGHDALYSQAMVWSRRLTDNEVGSLVADPFGWYSPRRETVLVAGPFPIFAVNGPDVLESGQTADILSVAGPYAPVSVSSDFF